MADKSGFAGQGGSFGGSTINSFAGAAGDIFSGIMQQKSLNLKAQGDEVEAGNYDEAAQLALQNKEFTRQSTDVKQVMADREIYMGIGAETSGISGSGFNLSGSALDLLRSSSQQGALQKQLIGQQGLITEAGYQEAADSYSNMATYARSAAETERSMGKQGKLFSEISGGIKMIAGIASMA